MTFCVAITRQLADLGADQLERALRLGLDLLRRLLDPPAAVGLELVAHALLLRLGHLARAREDLLGLASGLGHHRAVLLEHLARL